MAGRLCMLQADGQSHEGHGFLGSDISVPALQAPKARPDW